MAFNNGRPDLQVADARILFRCDAVVRGSPGCVADEVDVKGNMGRDVEPVVDVVLDDGLAPAGLRKKAVDLECGCCSDPVESDSCGAVGT